jgi:DNA-binding transcriptional ArsR family regulator
MLISMVMKGTLTVDAYYVVPEKYNPSPEGKQMSSGCRDIVLMPSYPVEKPKQHLIEFLRLIKENNKPISKRRLVEKAVQKGLLTRDARNAVQQRKGTSYMEDENGNSLYMRMNSRYLDPLEKMGLVEVVKEGRSRKVHITDDGFNMLTFLG